MVKKNQFVVLGAIVVLVVATMVYFATDTKKITVPMSEYYSCPDTKKLDYDEKTQTYTEWFDWKGCVKKPNTTKCDVDTPYKKWVNEKCGIKYKIKIAY